MTNRETTADRNSLRIRPLFAWYDLWVGVFVDRAKRRVYVFPVPCFGVVIEWGSRRWRSERCGTCADHSGVECHDGIPRKLRFASDAACKRWIGKVGNA